MRQQIVSEMKSLQELIDSDIYAPNHRTIDVQKVLFLLWENRDNSDAVKNICELLSYFLNEKPVFADIEFYLPQVAHMIIHVSQNSEEFPLQKLATAIAQVSIHAALQLSFMFSAAMEDYQPEISNGLMNPNSNSLLFKRCATLLQDVDKAVIYGKEVSATALPYTVNPLKEVTEREMSVSHEFSKVISGTLLYKRNSRKSNFHSKPWKPRFFIVDQRILLCFRDSNSTDPLRAILLSSCRVVVSETHAKYGDCCFELISDSTNTRYLLRTESSDQRKSWVAAILSEIDGAPPLEMTSADNSNSVSCSSKSIRPEKMSSTQRKRFIFFKQMKLFVTNLTNICERLRFKDRSVRKFFLKHDMNELVVPPFSYLPLCTSFDTYHSILRAVPRECHAFSTKARVPALMIFETEKHHSERDVASFLSSELEQYGEIDISVPKMELVSDYKAEIELEDVDESGSVKETTVESKPSKFVPIDSGMVTWSLEGSGMKQLEQQGFLFRFSETDNGANLDADRNTKTDELLLPQNTLGETFDQKSNRLKSVSPYGHLSGWTLGGLIAKSNDDVRQEVFIMQLIMYYDKAFKENGSRLWLHTYQILSASKTTGLIELIPDAISIDGLKKKQDFPGSLRAWYETSFGFKEDGSAEENEVFEQALECYVSSMAAYGVVTYLLAIKDRHNGNIMVDKYGHIVHIDFGFVFGLAPGKAFSMEKAPWKLNKEMVSVMGGKTSKWFDSYKERCVQAFLTARKHSKQVIRLMEIMQYQSNYPAFRYNASAIHDFRSRLYLDVADSAVPKIVERLIGWSYKHSGSDLYDSFQLATNGIAK